MADIPNYIWLKLTPSFIKKTLGLNTNLNNIFNNTCWLLADKFLCGGIGLFVGAWIARHLGPDQFGLWNYAIAFAALFSFLSKVGLSNIVVRELVKNPKNQNQILGTSFLIMFLGGILSLILSMMVIYYTKGSETIIIWLVGLSAAGNIFQSTNVVDFYFQSKVQSRYSVIAFSAALIPFAVVKIALIIQGATLITFAWISLLEIIFASLFLLILFRINSQKILAWCFKLSTMKFLLRESWPLMISALAITLYMKADLIMLQEMISSEEVGIYAAATKISEAWYFLPMAILSSVSPSLFNNYIKDKQLYIFRLQKLYFFLFWLAVSISLPLTLLSTSLILVIYGNEYTASAAVLSVHLWGSIAVFLGVASSQALVAEGLQTYSFYRTMIGLIVNILLNLILIPIFGALGAALATVVSYFFSTYSLIIFKKTRPHFSCLLLSPFCFRKQFFEK